MVPLFLATTVEYLTVDALLMNNIIIKTVTKLSTYTSLIATF